MCIQSWVKGQLRNPVLHSVKQATRNRVSDYLCMDSLPDSSCQTFFSLLTILSLSSVVPKRMSKVYCACFFAEVEAIFSLHCIITCTVANNYPYPFPALHVLKAFDCSHVLNVCIL